MLKVLTLSARYARITKRVRIGNSIKPKQILIKFGKEGKTKYAPKIVVLIMEMDGDDSLLTSLIEREIPDGRKALIDSHVNLEDLSSYCKENYANR